MVEGGQSQAICVQGGSTVSTSRANPSSVRVQGDGDLHEIMDMCKASLSIVEEKLPGLIESDTATATEISDLRSVLKGIDARLDRLDHATSLDDKYWRAEQDGMGNGPYTRTYKRWGHTFTVAYKDFANGGHGKLEEGYTRATQAGDVDAAGGVLVKEEVYPEVAYVMSEKSLPRMRARVIPMTSDVMRAPILDTGPLCYYQGAQGTTVTESDLVFSKQLLEAKTLMALNIVALELTEDSVVPYEPFWAQVFGDSIALKETKGMLVENSTTPGEAFDGINYSCGVRAGATVLNTANTTAAGLDFDNVTALESATDENTWDGSIYVAPKATMTRLRQIRTTEGYPLLNSAWTAFSGFSPRPVPNQGRPTVLMDDDLYITSAVPSPWGTVSKPILFKFNPLYWFFGDRMRMSIRWSAEAGFMDGALVMRVRERYAQRMIVPKAFAVLRTSAT
jgi:HK97 family phage major capsid protein